MALTFGAACVVFASLASSAFANHLKDVTANGCKSITFNYVLFPNKPNNTISETVKTTGGVTIGTGTAQFNGPSGSSTVPITGGTNGETVISSSSWDTNGAKSPTPPPSFKTKLSCPCPPSSPNPAGAHASGNASGAILNSPLLDLNQTLSHTASTESGVGSNSTNNQLLTLSVPDYLTAGIAPVTSTSSVTSSPAQSTDLSTAETTNLSVLNGLITANVVRAVASATATGSSESTSSAGTEVSGLVIQGTTYNTTTPGETINLVPKLLGGSMVTGSVTIDEEVPSSTTASGLSGGTYSGDLTVNAIHIHLNLAPLLGPAATVDIIVSQAVAHADFPQTAVCSAPHTQEVSGHAFVASEATDPSLVGVTSGYAGIPSTGGSDSATLTTLGPAPILTGGAATSTSTGTLTPTDSNANSEAAISSKVCLLVNAGVCTISADAIDSDSSTDASASGASSTDAGTTFTNLVVNGNVITGTVAPNTTITLPGIGYVVLNEQTCDNGTQATHTCTGTAGHSGLTVRAIDVVVEQGALGLLPGAQVIVAEAHSDATFQ